ncbi:MAG: hypothetical protein JSW55_11605, partial [Chloroflexota bacterium]
LNNNGSKTSFKGSVDFNFADAEVTLIDDSVQVFDTNLVTATNPDGFIDTVSVGETPQSFQYQGQIGPFGVDDCGQGDHNNTATIRTITTGTEKEAIERVPYLCIETIAIAFEDLPLVGGTVGNDWDYNDIVVDVSPVLSYNAAGSLERVSFTFEQGGEFAEFSHVFSLQPTAFACDGTYTRSIGGVSDPPVDYTVGDNIVIIEDSSWDPQQVALTIDFDVPELDPGACPLDLSQDEFDIIGNFHGEGLFFKPWILVDNVFDNIEDPVRPGDVRLLNVPQDWAWPTPEGTPIWTCYPDGVSGPPPPTFSELWWQTESQCQ